jgi:hypothetical protein
MFVLRLFVASQRKSSKKQFSNKSTQSETMMGQIFMNNKYNNENESTAGKKCTTFINDYFFGITVRIMGCIIRIHGELFPTKSPVKSGCLVVHHHHYQMSNKVANDAK